MSTTIDSLQIEITQDSQQAVNGLDALTNSLGKLKAATQGIEGSLDGINFNKFTTQIKQLSTALQPLQGFKTQAAGLLSALRYFKDTAEELNSFSGFDKFASQIKLLADALQPLSGTGSKLGATLNALAQLPIINEQLASVDFSVFSDKIVALTESLAPLGTIQSKLGNTLNQLARFGQVIQQIDMTFNESNAADSILKLVKALEPLATIGKSNLGSTITQLKKLPEIVKQLADIDWDAFAAQINRAVSALRPLADEMNKIAAGFSAFPSRIQRLITQNEKFSASNAKTGKSFGILGTGISSLQAKFGIYYLAFRRLSSVIADWVTKSNAYVENLNLFTVSMGKHAGEALKYADRVQKVMGIDKSEWIRNQGIFMQIATGFGVVEDKAYQMSRGLTQISYDISSFFNIPIEEALTKVQSGISGELEPLRRLGYALDAATLQQIAYDHGITQNINKMTQAQKSQLRYIAIMQQSKNVMGDMSRTLITPANALRILNQELTQLARALGNMIIPLLIQIIPYVQAFVEVLIGLINNIARLFGFKLPKIDYSDMNGLTSSMNGFASGAEAADNALGDTNKTAKKLKNTIAGFDELHILPDEEKADNGSGKKGKGGIGGGYDLPLDLSKYNYDFLGKASSRVDEIAEKIQKPFENALKLAGLIGVAIVSWKMSEALYSLFTGTGTNIFFKNVHDLGKAFNNPSGETIKLMSTFGDKSAYVGTAAVIAGIADTIAIMILRTADLVKNSERFRDGVVTIGKGITSGVKWLTNTAFPAIGKFFSNLIPPELKNAVSTVLKPIDGFLKALDIDTADWLITLTSVALLFTPAAPFAKAVLIFEGITVAIRGIGLATSDAVEKVDLFGGISDTTKKKVEPFVAQMRSLNDTITTLDWTNMIIDQSIVDDVAKKTKAISTTIINELDSDKNESLATLAPLKKALGEEAYNELLADNAAYYEKMATKTKDNEARINEIMKTAKGENRALTQAEKDEINRIQDEMMNTGIKHLSETEVEYQTIMNRLKDNSTRISLEQASSIIKDAQATRDESVAAAETQYAKVELEAQRMLDVGAINDKQYKAIIDAAAKAKDDTIDSANKQYDTIYNTTTTKLGDTAKYIDANTGEIKSKWDVFCDNTAARWDTTWTNIKNRFITWGEEIETGWNNFKNTFKTGWCAFWNSIGNFFIDIGNGIVSGFESAVNWIIKGLNHLVNAYNNVVSKIPGIGSIITVSNIRTVSFGRVPRLYVPQFNQGGFPNMGQLFVAREAGAELVGGLGRKAAVMNNDQIVDSVSQGVYEAVVAAMPKSNEQPLEVKVYLDGKEITKKVEKVQRERGTTLLPGGVVVGW